MSSNDALQNAELLLENRQLIVRLQLAMDQLAHLAAAYREQSTDLARRVAELECLAEISQHLNAAGTLDEVLDAAYEGIRTGLGYDRVGIDLIDHDQGLYQEMRGTDQQGQKTIPERRGMPLGPDSPVWRLPGVADLLKGARLYYTPNISAEMPEELIELLDGPSTENLMAPLRSGDRVIGTISVDNLLSGRPISPDTAGPLLAVCNHVSTAVERILQPARQQLEHARLRALATTDVLTGLPNRAHFGERLAQEVGRAARDSGTFAVLILDLNRFKQVNDTLGHAAGDVALATVARRMRAVLRVEDTLARLGGDEFAMVLPGADEQSAQVIAEKVRAAIRAPIQVEHDTVSVDVSIGLTEYPHHADAAGELLRGADLAMYVAKTRGGGTTAYSAEVEEQNAHSRELLHDLRLASELGQLRLFFQPVLDGDSGMVVRAEALLRWQHPTLGLLRPRRFLPAADLSDTVDRVTVWVLEEALRQCRQWHLLGLPIGVEVNTPVRSLQDRGFPGHVRSMLDRHGVAPRDLTLTVPEHALMLALDDSISGLMLLSDMGVRIGLDEFGVGQSSLSALSRLPLSQIKVDRSFVAQATTAHGASLIAMILGITATLGLTAVADGVEQQETWNWLLGLGRLQLQGYHASRPLPADEFARWLAAQACGGVDSVLPKPGEITAPDPS